MTFIVRTSERRDFLRCQQRWWWGWRMGLRPRGREADALWFGTGIHLALAIWYCGPGEKRGPEPAETWSEWSAGEIRRLKTELVIEDDETEAVYVDARELGRVMMEEYVKLYGRDPQKLIIAPEKTFALDVPWPSDQMLYPDQSWHGNLLRYVGTFDGVWRHADTGQIWLDEHKTAGQIYTGHLTLDPQAGAYWAVAAETLRREGLIGPRERLAGIEYNFMRKALPDDRPRDAEGFACNKPTKAHYAAALEAEEIDVFERRPAAKWRMEELEAKALERGLKVLGERSKVQPAKNFERVQVPRTRSERAKQIIRLQQEALHMQALRDGVLPVLKNPDRSCNQGAFRCPFFELCEVDERGGDTDAFIELGFRRQDPYADHRLR